MASVLLRGFLLGFVIAASPGPIFFLCLRRTLARGWAFGLVSGLGVATADGFYATLAAFGIGAVTSVLVGQRFWLAVVGGIVLILLGLRTVMDRPKTLEPAPAAGGSGFAWAYLSTLGLTITNPSTIVSFAALVASLGIGLSGGYLPPVLLVLGVVAGSATWWFLLAGIGARVRARVTPRVVRAISVFSGVAIVALGVVAILSTLAATPALARGDPSGKEALYARCGFGDELTKARTRTVTWEDPMAALPKAAGMSGMEFIRAVFDGTIPPPPIMATMAITGGQAEEGKVVFVGEAGEFLYNPIGVVHAGFAMTILDSAMGCAVHTTLAVGERYTTLETKVNFVRAITAETGPVRCEGVVVHRGGRVATAEAKLFAENSGKLLAHGSSTCLVISG